MCARTRRSTSDAATPTDSVAQCGPDDISGARHCMTLDMVTLGAVREELRALGRDDVPDDVIERFLTERRRGGGESATAARVGRDDSEAVVGDDEVRFGARATRRSDNRRRASSVRASTARPPWDGNAFDAVPPPPKTSLHLDELPRRQRAESTAGHADAIEGRDRRGRIDVVRVGAIYREQWEKVAPAVVLDRPRPREGFAERFAQEHRKEERRRDELLEGRRRYRY